MCKPLGMLRIRSVLEKSSTPYPEPPRAADECSYRLRCHHPREEQLTTQAAETACRLQVLLSFSRVSANLPLSVPILTSFLHQQAIRPTNQGLQPRKSAASPNPQLPTQPLSSPPSLSYDCSLSCLGASLPPY